MRRHALGTGLMALALSSVLAACGAAGTAGTAGDPNTGSGKINVLASTNVYGDIATLIGGNAVQVTSVIDNPDQDPHSFEANTQVALKLSKAQIVIENGGGYDDFVDTMLNATDNKPVVLNAVTISGRTAAAGGELNEHIWYDFPSIQKVAGRLAAELGNVDPGQAATFTANASTFNASVDKLIAAESQLKSSYAGEGVGITEPVPLYLLEAIGLENKTPAEFSEAVEEGEEVSAAVLKQTLDLYADNQVKVLVYNAQTEGPITEQVQTAAQQAGIGVVGVTETLPADQTYLTWMQSNLDNIGKALGQE